MRRFMVWSAGCALLMAAGVVPAQETVIYRCTDANGAVTLQNDTPCAAGMKQDVRRIGALPTASPPTRTPAPARVTTPPPGAQFEQVAGPRREMPASSVADAERMPPPTLFQCRTWDNDDYISETGEPEPRCIPLQTTDSSGNPMGGAGSACEVVRDTCTEATGEALCKAWHRRVDEAAFRLKFSSPASDDPRKAEYDRLAQILADSNCS